MYQKHFSLTDSTISPQQRRAFVALDCVHTEPSSAFITDWLKLHILCLISIWISIVKFCLPTCNQSFFTVQIIHFLRTRAHPVLLKQVNQASPFVFALDYNICWLVGLWRVCTASSSSASVIQTPVLPPTITDQIRLWELERDRLQFTEGEHSYLSVCAGLGGITVNSLMFINDRPNLPVLYMYFVVFYWHLSLLSELFACCLDEFSVMCHCHCPFSISTTTGSCHAHHSAENSSDTCYFQSLNNCCQFYTFYHMY